MGKREEMLSVALSLFTMNGYENVGIQKIVEDTGVKKPTLYHYFGSKQGLLVTLLNHYLDPFLKELGLSASYNGDVTVTLRNIVNHYFRFASGSPDFYRFTLSLMYSSEESEARKTVLPFVEKQYEIFEKVFQQAERDHGNMKGRSKRYAITFLGMINSYITTSFYENLGLDEEKAGIACQQFMYGIFS